MYLCDTRRTYSALYHFSHQGVERHMSLTFHMNPWYRSCGDKLVGCAKLQVRISVEIDTRWTCTTCTRTTIIHICKYRRRILLSRYKSLFKCLVSFEETTPLLQTSRYKWSRAISAYATLSHHVHSYPLPTLHLPSSHPRPASHLSRQLIHALDWGDECVYVWGGSAG